MPTPMSIRFAASAVVGAALFAAVSAQAQEVAPPLPPVDTYIEDGASWDTEYEFEDGDVYMGESEVIYPGHSPIRQSLSAEERDAWLAECRARYEDDGLGGALIGGVVGGVAGNRIAGEGNRTIGTAVGAVAGAAVGAAIDKAEDNGALEACEAELAQYESDLAYGHGPHHGGPHQDHMMAGEHPCPSACGQAYPYPVMWVPVRYFPVHRHGPGCGHEREVVEWETVWVEEDVVVTKEVPITRKVIETKTVPVKATPVKATKAVSTKSTK